MTGITGIGATDHRSAPPQGTDEYVVRRGDSLWSIARQHGVSLAELDAANPELARHDFIFPGDRVVIPSKGGSGHIVRSGETVSGIARRHGVSVQAIVAANGLRNPDLIHPGDRLSIPSAQASRPTTRPPSARAPAPAPDAAPEPAPRRTPPAATPAPAANGGATADVRTMFDPRLGSRARGAIIIGQAEGTRTPTGGFRPAYYGHIDPGNGVPNRGSFSLQNAGNLTPEQADARQLERLGQQIPAFETAARAAGLDPNNATLATGYLDLYNQSPTAARRFLDQIGTLRETGVTRQSVTDLRVASYVNRETGERFTFPSGARAGSGFVNIARTALGRAPTEAEVQRTIRADQSRRMRAMDAAITNAGTTAPAGPRAARFTHNPGIDLTPTTIANANGLYDSVRAATGHSINVTSGRRDPGRQAAAMYNNFADNSSPRYANQAAFNEVREAYRSGQRDGIGRAATIGRMTTVLQGQVDRGVLISRHMSDRAIDVAMPPAATRQAVIDAMRDNPAVQSVGVEDDHLHVQFR